jgi:hypothetical protein
MKAPLQNRPIDRHLRVNAQGGFKLRFSFALPCVNRQVVEIGLHTHDQEEARTRAVIFLRMLHSINTATKGILGLIFPMDKETLSQSKGRRNHGKESS